MTTNFVVTFAKLANLTLIRHAGVPERITGFRIVCNFDFRRLNDIVQKFGEIRSRNPGIYNVQQASIITGVSLTTFARGDTARQCSDQLGFSLLFARGNIDSLGRLHTRRCHAFLVLFCLLERVCLLLLRLSVHLHNSKTMRPNFTSFLCMSLGPLLTASQYVIYFRFYGWRHVFGRPYYRSSLWQTVSSICL